MDAYAKLRAMATKSSITEAELDTLVSDLDRRRKEIEEDARAIARVKKMMQARKNGSPADSGGQPLFPMENGDGETSFNESVRRTARQFGQQSFTVPLVEEQLAKQGVPLKGKKTRPRISMVLKKMCDDHVIMKIRGGAGTKPHVYKVV